MHIRTPILFALIVLLVVLLSAFCYYQTVAPGEPRTRPVSALSAPALEVLAWL